MIAFRALLALVPSWLWVALGAAGLLTASIAYVDHRGDVRGAARVQAKWDADKVATAKQRLAQQEAQDAKDKKHAAEVDAIGDSYENTLKYLQEQRGKDVAAARSGALRLRVPGGCVPAPAQSGTDPGGRDGPAGSELPPAVAADLAALAGDADIVANQLGSCQRIARALEAQMKGNP